jgi:bifunctional non-homologous end joining protein LigD
MKRTASVSAKAISGGKAAARRPRRPTPRSSAAAPIVAGVPITHADRSVYPVPGVTKLQVAEYYERIAPRLLPYVADRPLSIVRCPEGTGSPCFFQKHLGQHAIPGVEVAMIEDSAGRNPYIVANTAKALVGLAQMHALELHVWSANLTSLERPDSLIFDLDPGPGLTWAMLVAAARRTRSVLDALGLGALVKTTGGKGVHVVVPLQRRHGWDEVKDFAHGVAVHMAQSYPDQFTATLSKARRRGKVFVDYLRNVRGATAVAAYSLRARAEPTVATPLAWDELSPAIEPGAFTLTTVLDRVARRKDPWAQYERCRQRLTATMRRSLR